MLRESDVPDEGFAVIASAAEAQPIIPNGVPKMQPWGATVIIGRHIKHNRMLTADKQIERARHGVTPIPTANSAARSAHPMIALTLSIIFSLRASGVSAPPPPGKGEGG